MNKYIPLSVAVEVLHRFFGGKLNAATVEQELNSIPAVNVRPVVLCRDCRNYSEYFSYCGCHLMYADEDDFCSRGEYKDGADMRGGET